MPDIHNGNRSGNGRGAVPSRNRTPSGNDAQEDHIQFIRRLEKLEQLDADRIILIGETFGQAAGRVLPTRKLRKIHGQIVLHVTRSRSGRTKPSEIRLIKYHLAYAEGRGSNWEQPLLKSLRALLGAAADKVTDMSDLDRLRQLSESLIAFHRYYGGKE